MTCCETMRPSPERPAIASCTSATGTRTVSEALPSSPVATDDDDDVAAERAGEVECVLRRTRDGIGIGDLDGQRRADALRAIGRRRRRGLDAAGRHSCSVPSRRSWPPRCRLRVDSSTRQRPRSARCPSARVRARLRSRSASAAAAGTATSSPRRTGKRQLAQGARAGCSAAISRTRARSVGGADGREARSSWIRSGDDVMVSHPLFELRQARDSAASRLRSR